MSGLSIRVSSSKVSRLIFYLAIFKQSIMSLSLLVGTTVARILTLAQAAGSVNKVLFA